MRRLILTAPALAVLLLLPAALLLADAPKGDKALDGEWEAVSLVADGKEQPTPLEGKPAMTIKADAVAMKIGNTTHMGAIKVDASKTPKTIDLMPADGPDKGDVLAGVYEIKGDELRVCGANAGKDRPTDFTSLGGSGRTLTTFKRVQK